MPMCISDSGCFTGVQLRKKICEDLNCPMDATSRKLMELVADCISGSPGSLSCWYLFPDYQERIQRLKNGERV